MAKPWVYKEAVIDAGRLRVYGKGWRGLWRHLVETLTGRGDPPSLILCFHVRGEVEISRATLRRAP